jgi:hypothetical protein
VDAVGDSGAEQLMPGGVELDLVDAPAVAVVAAEHGRVGVGLRGQAGRLLRAGQRADRPDRFGSPAAALAGERVGQYRIGVEQVPADQRRRLVGDLVRRLRHGGDPRPDGWIPSP